MVCVCVCMRTLLSIGCDNRGGLWLGTRCKVDWGEVNRSCVGGFGLS